MIVYGFDISTSKIGWSIVEQLKGNKRYITNIKKIGVIPLGYIGKNTTENLIKKVNVALSQIFELFEEYPPDKIQIEDSLQNYKFGNTRLQIIIDLASFNFTLTWAIYRKTKLVPIHIHPQTARKNVFGSTFRGIDNKKQAVMNGIIKMYPDIIDKLPLKTRGGNKGQFAESAYDITDAMVIALNITK